MCCKASHLHLPRRLPTLSLFVLKGRSLLLGRYHIVAVYLIVIAVFPYACVVASLVAGNILSPVICVFDTESREH